ncbi:hypothetical protein NPIL_414451 [Nephila pilipes]|uniref:Uncharacterized protein n=1 Tax=Nephila pilipes TaxID=299642 RepID=A0A8X6NGH7_NEPPI|nr:hypothetical protein NPIL_414451 [Nephila pilipes]
MYIFVGITNSCSKLCPSTNSNAPGRVILNTTNVERRKVTRYKPYTVHYMFQYDPDIMVRAGGYCIKADHLYTPLSQVPSYHSGIDVSNGPYSSSLVWSGSRHSINGNQFIQKNGSSRKSRE